MLPYGALSAPHTRLEDWKRDGRPGNDEGAGSLTWSPDNRRIAFVKDVERTRNGVGIPSLRAVFVLNVEDGTVSKIADGAEPSWSPSGEWIAFSDYSQFRDDGRGGWYADNANRVSLIHPNGTGSKVVKLLKRDEDLSLPPVWSPDSRDLLIQRPQDESVNPRMDIYMPGSCHSQTHSEVQETPACLWMGNGQVERAVRFRSTNGS